MVGSGRVNYLAVVILLVALDGILCLPVVTQKAKTEAPAEEAKDSNVEHLENVIEYNKYLQEVVKVLESDPSFREKLDKAQESDIRSGKIAQELEYVNHNVRSKLDELKRIELQRLQLLARRQYELTNDIDRDHLKIAEHVDHENQHTFEIEDLKKLILKTSQDLSESDRRRREEFKQYELQKEFEKQEKIRELDEEHRKKYEEELEKQKEKHENHEKIHHPGNKAQLEEVWEKQDHMEGQDFDPKTFFMLHDIDGNGFWDENEVKVLFINELNKMYESGAPEDDMKERAEEMERMREHVFQEADVNKDGLISYEEFLEQTKRDEFQKDPDWETVDHQPQFTHEEYLEYERRNQEQIQRLIAEGKLPPHPNMPQGYYPGPNNGQYQVHPNAIPQNYQQQQQYHPSQQGHPNQVPAQHGSPQQGYAQQVNLHPNQVYQHHPDPNYQPHVQQQQPPQHQQSGQQSNVYQHPPQNQQQPHPQGVQQPNVYQNPAQNQPQQQAPPVQQPQQPPAQYNQQPPQQQYNKQPSQPAAAGNIPSQVPNQQQPVVNNQAPPPSQQQQANIPSNSPPSGQTNGQSQPSVQQKH